MSFTADLERAKLTVALDVRNPLAYLALRPAIDVGRDLKIEINWLPVESQPLHPPTQPRADDDRSIRHKRHRAKMIAREIAIYSAAQGLTVKEPYRRGPAAAANLAWLWVRATAPRTLEPFLEELFRRYWSLELDVASTTDVSHVVRRHVGEPSAFLAWADHDGLEAASKVADDLSATGITQAPSYLAGEELFWGRQHLPMIRRLLGDVG